MTAWPGAVIFDFDGVLVNSEELHMRAYLHTAQQWDIPLTRQRYFAELIGFDDRGAWSHLFSSAGRTIELATLDRIIGQKLQKMRQLMSEGQIQPLPGVREMIDWLEERRIPRGICTGALREEVSTMLHAIGMRDRFDAVVAAEDVAIGKPDPAGYLLTVRLLSEKIGRLLDPRDCLIFEDAPSVIRSVKSAGFRTVGVTTTFGRDRLADADWIVDSLDPQSVFRTVRELERK